MNLLKDISNLTFMQILVFGSILTGGFYFSFYNNGAALMKQIQTEESQLKKAEEELRIKKEELKRLIQFEEDLKRDEKSIGIFLDYIPEKMTTFEMFRFITQEAKISGVNIEDKTDHGVDEKEMVSALKASLRVSGSFQQVVFFLSKLTAQKRILVVDKIQIKSVEKSQQVMAFMDIYAYRYKTNLPSEEEKDGS